MTDAENNGQRGDKPDDIDSLLDDVRSIDRVAAGLPDQTELEARVDQIKQDVTERVEQIKQDVPRKAEEIAQMASERVEQIKQEAPRIAEELTQTAQEELAKGAQEVQRQMRQRADDARKEVVRQLNTVADTIRREAREAGASEDSIVSADDVARTVERAANYLNSRSVDDIGQDATQVVRDNPWRSVGIIFLLGLFVGMILRGSDNK